MVRAGQEYPDDRPHTLERLHCSLQVYPNKCLRPRMWREPAPGCCVAIHVRAGALIIRIFLNIVAEGISDRPSCFSAMDKAEMDNAQSVVEEVYPGHVLCDFRFFFFFFYKAQI